MSELNIGDISEEKSGSKEFLLSHDIDSSRLFLNGVSIGISISESDDLKLLGFSTAHLNDIMIETARYILAAGGNIVYGGDMRKGGFTELMYELLKYYKSDADLPSERFYSFLAWPLYLDLSEEVESSLIDKVTFRRIKPPVEIKGLNENEFLPPVTPDNLIVWGKCLTKMRTEMEKFCEARIFVGGRASGFKGTCPGLLEELLIAIKKEHPVYLVGAFGGVVHECIKVIDNGESNIFKENYYFSDSNYAEFYQKYNSVENEKIDYGRYREIIVSMGWKGLSDRNGLSEVDNKRLSKTPHIQEIVYLIFKGLYNVITFAEKK